MLFRSKEGVDTESWRLVQRYQEIFGDLEGHLRGAEISFRHVEPDRRVLRCTGKVAGERMEGNCRLAGATAFPWSAVRKKTARGENGARLSREGLEPAWRQASIPGN